MKNILKIAVPVIILGVIGYFTYAIIQKVAYKKETNTRLQQLPLFKISTIDGNLFTEGDLLKKKSILVYYSTDCNYCEAEAIQLQNNKKELEKYNVLMVSANERDEILKFRDTYSLKQKNIIFAIDTKEVFANAFRIQGAPIIIIYDENGELLKRFNGSVNFSKIKEILNN